jgi:predicted PurR-regulated permease PerM
VRTVVAALTSVEFAGALVAASVVIAALHFGRDILIPLALALFLGFVLSPLVDRLRRWGAPRAVAVTLVLVASLAVLVAAGVALGSQVRALSEELPIYRTNIQQKVRDLRQRIAAPGMFDGAVQTLDAVKKEVERKPDGAPPSATSSAPPPRTQVEAPSPLAQAQDWLKIAAGTLATAGIVLVFLFLVLIDRQDLRDRLLRLLGGNLHRTTDAMDEAGTRISRYLTMQLVVNACYGVPMAVGLWLIGVPGAVVWGAVAAVMRFMPYVGPMIAAVFPLAIAFAVDPGWSLVLWTLALIALLEVLSNNVVEPWLYGASTGLSALSLMVSASFWTVLWGPIGLVMATPLTVCLLVIGRHLPQLQALDVLLGSQPALDLPTRLYQRLLAGDAEEAIELAVERAQADGLAAFYNQAGVPALRHASDDHERVSTAEHRHRVVSGMDQIIDELREQYPPVPGHGHLQVVCLGAKWEVDTLAARMLAHALSNAQLPADHATAGIANAAGFAALDLQGARMVCLSHFSAEPQTQARYLCRRLRRRWPDLHIVLALWNAPPALLEEADHGALGADAVVTSIDEAVMHFEQQLGTRRTEGYLPAPVPEGDFERVRALRASGVLGEHLRPQFDSAAKRAADIFDVPLAMVSMIDEDTQHIIAASGSLAAAVRDRALGPTDRPTGNVAIPRSLSVCGHVVASAETLIVDDIARDPRFASNPVLRERGLRFYAGAPLRDAGGSVYGTLCLLGTKPRSFTEREVRLLEAMALELMSSVLGQENGPEGTGQAEPLADVKPELSSATVGQPVPE